MRAFVLQRDEDPTGVSGTGVVAEGIEFSDGTVALRWCVGEHRSTAIWPGMASVEAIHGHDGRTRVLWWSAGSTTWDELVVVDNDEWRQKNLEAQQKLSSEALTFGVSLLIGLVGVAAIFGGLVLGLALVLR